MGDLKSVLERIVALRHTIIDDGIAHGVPFHLNDLHTLTERLESEGSSFVKVTLPTLGKALDQGLVSGAFSCPKSFRCRKDTCIPVFCGDLFNEIFTEDGVLRMQPNLSSIYFLRQFLMLDGKLISEPSVLQKKLAIDSFRHRQKTLGQTKVDVTNPVLIRAKLLLSKTLKYCDLSDIVPGHGPGGVAEKYNRIERWDIREWPRRAERWYPFHVYGCQSFVALCASGPPLMRKNSSTRCSLVPKDYKGPRLISAESVATQFLQQGQMRLLMSYIDRHPLLSRSIKLRDQTHNQRLCREAYASGSATIDLSNASDTVSAALVWFLFSGVPKLRSQLFCTRSQFMEIDREKIRITAFAPMGSANCFPVETLVFWAITMASVRFVQSQWCDASFRFHETRATLPSESDTASAVAVFGDDIIAPDYALATIKGTLESVGCELNTSKTCYLTPFRESCGSEWFNNTDITITRNRRYYYDAIKRIINYPVVLDLQRKFFLQGLVRTAALLSQWAREISPIATIGLGCYSPRLADLFDNDVVYRRVIAEGNRCFGGLRDQLSTDRVHCSRDTRIRGSVVESKTAFPSGLDRFVREQTAFDTYCCAIGWYTSLDRGVPTRYNKNYQRTECRLPSLFQQTVQWISKSDPETSIEADASRLAKGTRPKSEGEKPIDQERGTGRANRVTDKLFLESGYPRLFARVIGDSVERIAIRSVKLKMAWSELPLLSTFIDLSS